MARDLLWVCDELYRLHQDLEEIRRRQAAAQVAPTQESAQLPTAPDSTTDIVEGGNDSEQRAATAGVHRDP